MFSFVISSFYIPVVSHFHLKVPKACVLKLNILYLSKTMLDFLDVQT